MVIKCSACAGELQPTGLSQRLRCNWCGADNVLDAATYAALAHAAPKAPSGANLEALLGKLRANLDHAPSFLDGLAERLAHALDDRLNVERSGGLFGKAHIERLTAELGDYQYVIALRHGQLHAERLHVVRGVKLRSQELSIGDALEAIAAALWELAQSTKDAEGAMARLLR